MPAQSRGAVAAGSRFAGGRNTNASSTTIVFGVAAVRHAAEMLVFAVVGEGRGALTILLQTRFAGRARAVGVHHAANRGEIAFFESAHLGSGFDHSTDNLVTGHDRVSGVGPLVARGVQVGVTNATVEDVDLNIRRAGFTAFEGKWLERRSRGMGCVTGSFYASLLFYRPLGSENINCICHDKFLSLNESPPKRRRIACLRRRANSVCHC